MFHPLVFMFEHGFKFEELPMVEILMKNFVKIKAEKFTEINRRLISD